MKSETENENDDDNNDQNTFDRFDGFDAVNRVGEDAFQNFDGFVSGCKRQAINNTEFKESTFAGFGNDTSFDGNNNSDVQFTGFGTSSSDDFDQIHSDLGFAAQLKVDLNHQVQDTTPSWNNG